jgi:hypothetical protein
LPALLSSRSELAGYFSITLSEWLLGSAEEGKNKAKALLLTELKKEFS